MFQFITANVEQHCLIEIPQLNIKPRAEAGLCRSTAISRKHVCE